MQKPLISVIVPVFNVETYIRRCIESIQHQFFSAWELIIVDDGSTDKSGSICDEYAAIDNRIRVFHKKNEGVSCARNIGIDKANGDWIYFVDSDDYLNPEHLQNYASNLDADIIYQGYRLFDEKTDETIEIIKCNEIFANGDNYVKRTLYDIFIFGTFFGPTWNKIFKASILKEHNLRFNPEICYREDELLTFQYCKYIKSIHVLPTCSYNYQKTIGSLMRGYRNPEMCFLVANESYKAAKALCLDGSFDDTIENYYDRILRFTVGAMYYPNKLLDRKKRLSILSFVHERYEKHPNEYLGKIANLNVQIFDLKSLLLYYIRIIVRKILKR